MHKICTSLTLEKLIPRSFQKEHKKKEDPAGKAKHFRPEPSSSSRDSTATQLSSKSASHSGQPASHGHHRESYNAANKRHFGNDGRLGRDYFRLRHLRGVNK